MGNFFSVCERFDEVKDLSHLLEGPWGLKMVVRVTQGALKAR